MSAGDQNAHGQRGRRDVVRRALLLVPALVLLATAARGPADAAQTPQPPLTGLLVLSSATADDLEAMPDGGIVVRFTLENRTGGDIAGATLRATLPAETAVADSWEGEPGRGTGTVSGGAIAWEGVSLADGAASAAFAARLVPASGANGASLFRFATI